MTQWPTGSLPIWVSLDPPWTQPCIFSPQSKQSLPSAASGAKTFAFLVRMFPVYHQGWGLSLHLGVLNPMSPCLTYLTELLSGWPLPLPFLLSLTWNLCFNCQLSLYSSLDFLVSTFVSLVGKWQLHREGLLCSRERQKHLTAFAKAFLYVPDVQPIMFRSHTWLLHLLFIPLARPL